VVRAIDSNLHMDYTAVGQTTHLAARLEQMAKPGSVLTTGEILRLAEGFVQVRALGPVSVKGLADPVEVFELVGAASTRTRLQVPATVQAVLAARIDRLPPEEKRLLQTAAVIGTEVPFTLLQAIAELSEEDLRRGLGHLQAAEFLYETSLFPELEYTFKHALTHEVAYRHSPAGAAPCRARRHCRSQRTALCRPSARAGRTAGPACLAGRGLGQSCSVRSASWHQGIRAFSPVRGCGVLRAILGSPQTSP